MFKPDAMKQVNLFILEKDLYKVSNLLYDLKLVEFFETNPNKFDKFEHQDLSKETGNLLKLRSTISILKPFFSKNLNRIDDNPLDKTLELKKSLDKLEREILQLKDEIKRETILKELGFKSKDNLNSFIVGFISKDKGKYLKNFSGKTFKLDGRIYFKTNTKPKFAFKEFYLPKTLGKNLSETLVKKEKRLDDVKNKLSQFSNGNLRYLEREELKLSKLISTLEAKTHFAKTKNLVTLSGFVPKKDLKLFNLELEKNLADKFELDVIDAGDNAPIKLSNSFASKFEALLRMYSFPKYGEFDPTVLMFLIFPLFFGFILGDVIYGLISLIVFTIAKRKLAKLKDFISVLQVSAISSMIFGVIYGEFMGFEFHGSFYGLFERAHHPETLLVIAVIFGLIHINLGLIIGFVNELKNLKKAVCDKLSWIIMEIGAFLLGLGVYVNESTAIVVGTIFAILGIVLIYMGHGFIGIIEVPSFFTNILSYARLMAVGLSSIAIAVLINEYTIVLFSKGFFGILGAIVLFTAGHIFNIVLGNFEGFLHTLRLHYVEFFTKFYTGGGKEFEPFGKRVHSEE